MHGPRVNAADIAEIGIFEGLPPEALETCAASAVLRVLVRGQAAFAQGEPCTRFHAVRAGGVRISQSGREGGLALIRFVGPGEPFGSLGMFGDGFYPAEATAVEASIEVSWSRAHFRGLIERYPVVAISLVALAARRMSALQERLREVTTLPVEQRIAHALLRLSRENGRPVAAGCVEIGWPLIRKDVADISGTALYSASRVMARWERENLIQSTRKRITIRSVTELTRIADSSV